MRRNPQIEKLRERSCNRHYFLTITNGETNSQNHRKKKYVDLHQTKINKSFSNDQSLIVMRCSILRYFTNDNATDRMDVQSLQSSNPLRTWSTKGEDFIRSTKINKLKARIKIPQKGSDKVLATQSKKSGL